MSAVELSERKVVKPELSPEQERVKDESPWVLRTRAEAFIKGGEMTFGEGLRPVTHTEDETIARIDRLFELLDSAEFKLKEQAKEIERLTAEIKRPEIE